MSYSPYNVRGLSFLTIALFLPIGSGTAFGAIELVSNGTFSLGLTGWSATNSGSGFWFSDTVGTTTPLSGISTSAANGAGAAASGGYAVTDQTGPGTHALEQSFIVPGLASSVILSFDMFVNDYDGGPIVNPAGLTHTAGTNQHARVDILSAGSAPFATGGSVLANFYLGVDAGADPHAFTHYSFDITSLVGLGGAFELRFAEVDNQSYTNQGIDNVSIQFTAQPNGVVPEPLSVVVWSALGAVGALFLVRRDKESRE